MTTASDPRDRHDLPAFAPQWMAQWRIAAARLELLRSETLRALTQRDAARIFALLDPPRPYELRSSSGLVEQQRWFDLLRRRAASAGAALEDPRPGGEGLGGA